MTEMIALGVVYQHQRSPDARCAAQHSVRIAVEFYYTPLFAPQQVFVAEAD